MLQQTLTPVILQHISKDLGIPLKSLVATSELLDQDATVPFIARYRKEVTGNLDEVQIRSIQEKVDYFRELEERRQTVLKTIEERGKLTPELQLKITSTLDKNELEDLYLPYKPKRRTKAAIAREQGLEALADYLWNQEAGTQPLAALAATFVNPEKNVSDAGEALQGARYIVSERVSEVPEFRQKIREIMLRDGIIVSRAIEGAADPEGKFKMYADYRELVAKIPSHRMLAIRRGAEESILRFEIELDQLGPKSYLQSKVMRAEGDWSADLREAIDDAYDRLINPSVQTQVRLELKERSDLEAIRVFRENLDNLLLAPPAGALSVLGIDPGIRTGCKIAVVDDTGKFLEHTVIYPLEPRRDTAGATKTLQNLITRHHVQAIAMGNGTGSREISTFIQDFLRDAGLGSIISVVVNESGASVYAASDIARQEFPDLDLTVRGAISIARRLQDPLAELVKIDPKSIGVGQYQHDVDQRKLKQGLEATVESCVNRVGVDLNTASWALLRYVAGITERTAQKIVEFRNEHGLFKSRVSLKAVPGFGPKTFEQAAGFLRIRGGENPLDMTAVHPESYAVVQEIAKSLNVTVPDLINNATLVDQIDLDGFRTEAVGVYTLSDIREELKKPGRDPRSQFTVTKFRDDVREIVDLKPGMTLDGVITNVTRFGAFVDIGVHQDGLVHVSELSRRYIADPSEFVKAGQSVKVLVLSVDPKAKRVALSMKALEAGPVPQQPRKPSLEQQLTKLSDRFRTK